MSTELSQLQRLANATKKLRMLELREAYDPNYPESRPTPTQALAFREQLQYPFQNVRGGNQCLVKGTLVMTPTGPVTIEAIRVGDQVYDEFGHPIRVLATYQNGPKEVADVTFRGTIWASCTADHVWQVETKDRTWTERKSSELSSEFSIRRVGVPGWPCIAAEYGLNPRTEETYDIHVESPTNLYLLANGLVTHNSGKSAYGSRTVAWFFNRDHPFIDIEAKWGRDPILIIVLCQNSTHYEEHWEKRIQGFLPPGSYKETRVGGVLKTVRHKTNGSKILFISYEDPYAATDRVQSFTGQLIWIDELCDYLPLYEEAERRIQRHGGHVIVTYTQKKPAPLVRRYLDSQSKYKKSYTFSAFDNPVYTDELKDRILASINQYPLEERERRKKMILEGDYEDTDSVVYQYEPTTHAADLPPHYDPALWRHQETIDPAAAGKVGLVIAAEDPRTGVWYVIKAKYIKGEAATTLLDLLAKETAGLNVTHRTSDSHEVWFIKEAQKRKLFYRAVEKDNRKDVLIKGPSEAFKAGWLKVVERECEFLVYELGSAKWSDKTPGHIQHSTKYHLLDALQYFVDTKPRFAPAAGTLDVLAILDLANKARKRKELATEQVKRKQLKRLRPAFGFRRSR